MIEVQKLRLAKVSIAFFIVALFTLEMFAVPFVLLLASLICIIISLRGVPPVEIGPPPLVIWTLVLASFYLPPLFFASRSHLEQMDVRAFDSYIAQHGCRKVGIVAVPYKGGSCVGDSECLDVGDGQESEFYCSVTGKLITFGQFLDGDYGDVPK